MKNTNTIHVVSCHAEGEVGDVIVGGVTPPPGDTIWDQRTWIDNDQTLRNYVLNEPRGGVFGMLTYWYPPKIRKQTSAGLSWNLSTPLQCLDPIVFA